MWYQVVVILGLMMARTALADGQNEMQQANTKNVLKLAILMCKNENYTATEEGKELCKGVVPIEPPSTTPSSLTTETVLNNSMMATADIGAPTSASPTATSGAPDSSSPNATSRAPDLTSSPTPASETPDLASPTATSEALDLTTAASEGPNLTSLTTASEAPDLTSSPTAVTEAPNSTEGDSSTITWTCIGAVLAVIVLVAAGFFIHRYTKRAGYHHSTKSNGDTGRAGTEQMSA